MQVASLRDQEEARVMEYESKLKELQAEIHQLKTAVREPVVVSCDHENEISQLQVSQ